MGTRIKEGDKEEGGFKGIKKWAFRCKSLNCKRKREDKDGGDEKDNTGEDVLILPGYHLSESESRH